VMVRTSTNG